jgi:ankyrin repeat protein
MSCLRPGSVWRGRSEGVYNRTESVEVAMAKADSGQIALNKSLVAAAAASSMAKVRAALDFGANPSFKDPDQAEWSPLHFACYFSGQDKSAERICELLLKRGADVESRCVDGASPLMMAASLGSLSAVELLLAKRAQVDQTDCQGMTPLMGAADRGDELIVRALLDAGADPETQNMKGHSAIALAQKRNRHDLAALMEAVAMATHAPSPRRMAFP